MAKWAADSAQRSPRTKVSFPCVMEGSIYRMAATKMEKYIVRLAIVLDAMRYGCDGKPIIELSGWVMEGALKLVDYYLICGMKARENFKYDPLLASPLL